jgi:hypothetical protein
MLGLLDASDDVLVGPLLPDSSVVTLDIGVLLRLAGLNHIFTICDSNLSE